MANTNSRTSKNHTYAIKYGFLGGPLVSRKFEELMKDAAFDSSQASEDADIIIAHSAGCWDLKQIKNAKILLMIGMPLRNPSPKTSFQVNRARTKEYFFNKHLVNGAQMSLLNTYYAITQPRRNLDIVKNAKNYQNSISIPDTKQIVFIANKNDPWPHLDSKLQELMDSYNWTFIHLPGSHDDIWEHPERYVDIIKHYAKLLG